MNNTQPHEEEIDIDKLVGMHTLQRKVNLTQIPTFDHPEYFRTHQLAIQGLLVITDVITQEVIDAFITEGNERIKKIQKTLMRLPLIYNNHEDS